MFICQYSIKSSLFHSMRFFWILSQTCVEILDKYLCACLTGSRFAGFLNLNTYWTFSLWQWGRRLEKGLSPGWKKPNRYFFFKSYSWFAITDPLISFISLKIDLLSGQWYYTSLIPALGRQRQADLCEFEVGLVYRVSSRTTKAVQRNPVSKNTKT